MTQITVAGVKVEKAEDHIREICKGSRVRQTKELVLRWMEGGGCRDQWTWRMERGVRSGGKCSDVL